MQPTDKGYCSPPLQQVNLRLAPPGMELLHVPLTLLRHLSSLRSEQYDGSAGWLSTLPSGKERIGKFGCQVLQETLKSGSCSFYMEVSLFQVEKSNTMFGLPS